MSHVQLRGFAHSIAAPTEAEGRHYVLKALKLGSLRPNTVVLNFPVAESGGRFARHSPRASAFTKCLKTASATRNAVIICKGIRSFPSSYRDQGKVPLSGRPVIDIWWIVHDGGLMLYLAHLLTLAGSSWKDHRIRLFTVIDPVYGESVHAVQQTLQTMVDNARINATAELPILLDNGAITAFSHDWTPRGKKLDGVVKKYCTLSQQQQPKQKGQWHALIDWYG